MARRKVASQARRDTAFKKLTDLSTARKTAYATAEKKRHTMYKGMLKAWNAGLTYDEIAEICELSKIRVSQILADQRGGS